MSITDTEMRIKVDFEQPETISPVAQDQMIIEFVNAPQFLKGVDGVAPSTDDEIKPGIYVPKQDSEIKVLEPIF